MSPLFNPMMFVAIARQSVQLEGVPQHLVLVYDHPDPLASYQSFPAR